MNLLRSKIDPMKHIILLITYLCITFVLQAQAIKTVNITAGGLLFFVNREGKYDITHLAVTGAIDARDFKTMRDSLPHLSIIDLSGSRIVAYSTKGYDGTNISSTTDWNTGEMRDSIVFNCGDGYSFSNDDVPIFAFRANITLTSIVLPFTATAISDEAFMACRDLATITIPDNIVQIGNRAFSECSSLKTMIIRPSIPVDLTEKTDVFKGINKNVCTLFVPVGSKGKYEVAAGWKDFKKITETK